MRRADRYSPLEAFPKWEVGERKKRMEQDLFLDDTWDQQASAASFVALTKQATEAERLTVLYVHLLSWCAVPREELYIHYCKDGTRRGEWLSRRKGVRRTVREKSRRREQRGASPEIGEVVGREAKLLPPLNRHVRGRMMERASLERDKRRKSGAHLVQRGRAMIASVRQLESVALQQFCQIWL